LVGRLSLCKLKEKASLIFTDRCSSAHEAQEARGELASARER
jgi:hypothetical protein